MGLSASQGRLLTLTARKSNIEFEIQQTTQAKLQLANSMDTESVLWSNGMNVQHLYYSPNGEGSSTKDMERLSYQKVTGSKENDGLGLRVIDSYGRKVVSVLPDPMPDGESIKDYVVEPYCTQADYFENNLKTGNWCIQAQSSQGWNDMSIEGSTFIYQGADSGDFAEANRSYDIKMQKLQRIEKNFDMRISQLAAQQQAIDTEIDSVKKVIDKNIEETFKTFG